jgi:5-methylcytosine-specific restriction endonuclease McrBC regulatory subunit McrC
MSRTKEQARKRSDRTRRVITDQIAEQQIYGETLIKLSEYSTSKPLSTWQQEVLSAQGTQLDFLGLELVPQLNGAPYLKASQMVGSARFVHAKKEVIVQVEPWAGEANFLRMLDRTSSEARTADEITRFSTEQTEPVGMFLDFFADQVSAFLHRLRYRNYIFAVTKRPGNVKGRLLIGDYLTKSLPAAAPHVLPCRYVDYSSDVLENRIIAFAIHLATQMTSLLPATKSIPLLKKLRTSARLLHGVSVRRVTASEIRSIRYNNLNRRFAPIHKLCEMIIDNYSVSLKAGERIPFLSLAIDMARLFESYVTALFATAFSKDFTGNKARLRFAIGAFEKHIVLDGMLNHRHRRIVIECKYKNIGRAAEGAADDTEESEFEVQGGKIRSTDIYQAAAYAVHEQVRADACILIYPSRSAESPAIEVATPITSFGWRRESIGLERAMEALPIYLMGVNLSAKFGTAVRALQRRVGLIIDASGSAELPGSKVAN